MLTIRNNIAADATISARHTMRRESLTSAVSCSLVDLSDAEVCILELDLELRSAETRETKKASGEPKPLFVRGTPSLT